MLPLNPPFGAILRLTRIVGLTAALLAAAAAGAGPAAAETGVPGGPPLTSGGDDTIVLHCSALSSDHFVGAIVVNRNGEFGYCHFVG